MSDLVKQLRHRDRIVHPNSRETATLVKEAADRIEALENQREALRAKYVNRCDEYDRLRALIEQAHLMACDSEIWSIQSLLQDVVNAAVEGESDE